MGSSLVSSEHRLELPPTLSIVVVNYNAWPDIVRLVDTLSAAPEVANGRCELIVVDNGSDGEMPAALAHPRAGVRLVARDDNGGFAAGVNEGWRQARGRWVLLLNPDVVAGPGLAAEVLARVAHHERRGSETPAIVGFALRNPDGTRQPSVGAEPGLLRTLVEAFLPRSRRKYKAGWAVKAGPVPWVTGACALVDGRVLAALGGLDDDFFLYYEEVALCRAARALGRSVEFDPSLEVVHLRPLQNRPVSASMRVITRYSKLLFFRKYGTAWQFKAIAGLTACEAAVRGAWAGFRGRTAERRAWATVRSITRSVTANHVYKNTEIRDLAAGVERQSHQTPALSARRRRPEPAISSRAG